MNTHIWIVGVEEHQFAPISTLVLSIKAPLDRGRLDKTVPQEIIYLANGVIIDKSRWDRLKKDIETHAVQLGNLTSF